MIMTDVDKGGAMLRIMKDDDEDDDGLSLEATLICSCKRPDECSTKGLLVGWGTWL